MIVSDLHLDRSHAFSIDEAYREFSEKGYVVFKSVIPRDLIAGMRQVWAEYFAAFSARRPAARRLLMHLPFKSPFYDPRFIENPLVVQIADRVLGKNYVCGYFGSETPLPGAGFMRIHFDLQCLNKWRPLNRPLSFFNKLLGTVGFYYGIQVSVPLVDSGPDNAPFEIWPATNRFALHRAPSEVILMPAGSILIRDIRNLHRGTPHVGAEGRPFLSLVYVRSWAPKWTPPEIPLDVYNGLPALSKRLFRHASIGKPVPPPDVWAQWAR